jgi:hypothetical protein
MRGTYPVSGRHDSIFVPYLKRLRPICSLLFLETNRQKTEQNLRKIFYFFARLQPHNTRCMRRMKVLRRSFKTLEITTKI